MSFESNEAFYDRIAGSYDALAHSSERESSEAGLKLLNPSQGDRVLEIGYGTGHATAWLARAVGPEGSVVGIDVSRGMCDVAGKRIAGEGLQDRVDLKVDTVPPISLESESLDAVFLSFTLELFPPDVIDDVVSECFRVLKPGGKLGLVAMALPQSDKEDTPLEKTYVWMHRHFPHVVDCHPIDVEATIEKGGFAVEKSEHGDIWSLPIALVLGKKP